MPPTLLDVPAIDPITRTTTITQSATITRTTALSHPGQGAR
ncbi:hypothetical protein JNB_00140 [Janibacter sp. HTCC2649]|nr:hypothetical protein JNB_00140 [Janibacter sp. HTCC2649]